jgi:hypothetical protein
MVLAVSAPKWRAPAWIFAAVATQLLMLFVSTQLSGNWGPIPYFLIVGLPVFLWQKLKMAEELSLIQSLTLGIVASVAVLVAWIFTVFLFAPPISD